MTDVISNNNTCTTSYKTKNNLFTTHIFTTNTRNTNIHVQYTSTQYVLTRACTVSLSTVKLGASTVHIHVVLQFWAS